MALPLAFLGFLRAISADMSWFSTCIAVTVLLAYLDVVELSAIFQTVPVRSVVHAPHSRLAIFARRNLELLGHVDERIFLPRLAFCVLVEVFLLRKRHCGRRVGTEFLLRSMRPWGKRDINVRGTFLRSSLADQRADISGWRDEVDSKGAIFSGRRR